MKHILKWGIFEYKIYGIEILPADAVDQLTHYVDVLDKRNRIEVYPDPQVDGTYALQIYRHKDDYTFHMLWYKGGYDDGVEFDQFPPKSSGLKFFF